MMTNTLRAIDNNEAAIPSTAEFGATRIQMEAATEILDSARALQSVAKSSDLPMIAYLLRLVILEAQDFLEETASEE